ncbi:MAG: TM0106 family RecB-like putative nuclease [Acidimicrobiia bacterium]
MELVDNRIVLSAGDLTSHLACSRLTALELGALRNGSIRPMPDEAEADVVRRRGDEHEVGYLERLSAQGREVVELARPEPGRGGLIAGEAATAAAMASGAEVIHHGTFFDGPWRGHPDFLFRVEEPSARWPWSYEVCDAKLARRVKAAAILQTCSYSAHVERIQGSPPNRIHVVGGDFTTRSYRMADFAAYYRRAKAALEGAVGARPDDGYTWPVEHCRVCHWAEACDARRRSEDHLSVVAGMRHNQARRFAAARISTVASLATPSRAAPVPGVQGLVAGRLRSQARLQLEQRRSGVVRHELVEPVEPGLGLCLLPPPSAGDVFFDMEGDPFAAADGLEYLFGVTIIEAGEPVFRPIWAHDKATEKLALEAFVDFVVERQRAYPDLHVYHYAPYEPSALKRLMGTHGTREAEIDALLRGGVFVDLYTVVRQGVRVSQESYSLKALEPLYMAKRDGAVTSAASSIVAYERWLLEGDDQVLTEIADYNRLDCESTWRLREWLEKRRIEAEVRRGMVLARPEPRVGEASDGQVEAEAESAALVARLTSGIPEDPAGRTPAENATWLLAQLLDWHRREARPEWWAYFARLEMSNDELLDDAEALSGLEYENVVGQIKQSLVHRYRFPPDQEHKIVSGRTVHDPATGKAAGTVERIDSTVGILDLKRGKNSAVPHPGSVIPGRPIDDQDLRQSLGRVGEWVAEHGIDADGSYRAVRDLLLRAHPRLVGLAGAPLVRPGEAADAAVRRLTASLVGGCLPVQGPPGTGKTWSGARAIVDLVKTGRRVGITATSHKAIGNLLDEVCTAAESAGVPLRALQRAGEDDRCGSPSVERVDNAAIVARLAAGTVDVVAGTQWLFARQALAGAVDVLVVDEAGQMSLANVVAMGQAAENVVLLGDPQQLAQPSKGSHPAGAGRSALEHILDGHATVPPERGILLDVTFRMHPDLCRFVSDAFYEGRLGSAGSCEAQHVDAGPWAGGTGLRWIPVEHRGNKVSSREEAAEVARGVAALLGRRWVDETGRRRCIGLDDLLVVAPCNAQVALLRSVLPPGARVGTVDKFQGQQAAVVIFSMATSSADDMPRNLEFLFSLNRLNVAISRARALAVLLCSAELLSVRCRTPEQMRSVNALCLLVERASEQPAGSEPQACPAA